MITSANYYTNICAYHSGQVMSRGYAILCFVIPCNTLLYIYMLIVRKCFDGITYQTWWNNTRMDPQTHTYTCNSF